MCKIVETYKVNMLASKKRPQTIEDYAANANRFIRFVKEAYSVDITEDVSPLNGDMVKGWIAKYRDMKDSTRNLVIIATRSFLNDLYTSGRTERDLSIALPKTKRIEVDTSNEDEAESDYDAHVFSRDDILHLMRSCPDTKNGHRTKALIAMFLGTGMRASEVSSLNVSDFDTIQKGYVKAVRKGGALKRIEVADFVTEYVKQYLALREDEKKPTDPLFMTGGGKRMTRVAIYKTVATRQKEVGCKTGLHKFRHTVLTDAEKIGGAAVSRDIGNHHSLNVTNRYVHTTQKERTQVINSLSYGKLMIGR